MKFNPRNGILQAILGLLCVLTVYTYFEALAQYGTNDQNVTLSRFIDFMKFLSFSGEPYHPNTDSHFAFFFIALPGVLLKRGVLDFFFHYGDTILPGWRYNPYFPYAFVQVCVALGLLGGIVALVGKLAGWGWKKDKTAYLVAGLIIFNFPWVKGLSKVIKYDALSLLLSTIAVLLYLIFYFQKKRKFFYGAFLFAALGFFEKEITALVGVFLMLTHFCVLYGSSDPKWLKAWFRDGGIALGITFVTGWVLMPIAWIHPSKVFRYAAYSFSMSGGSLWPLLGWAVGVVLVLSIWRKNILTAGHRIFPHVSAKAAIVVFTVMILFSLFDQKNRIFIFEHLSVAEQQAARASGTYIAPKSLDYRMTTLDDSSVLTHAKLLYGYLRLGIYSLPELSLALLSCLAFLLLSEKNKRLAFLITFFFGCFVFHAIALTAVHLPIGAKYFSNAVFFLVILSVFVWDDFWKTFCLKNPSRRAVALALVSLATLKPLLSNRPSALGYFNVIRSASQEQEDSLRVGFSDWTWRGWGEANYPIVKKLEKLNAPVTVAFDYVPPFWMPPQIKVFPMSVRDVGNQPEGFQPYLKRLIATDPESFLVISRINSARFPAHNSIIVHYEKEALFSVKSNGTTDAWLFKAKDLLKG